MKKISLILSLAMILILHIGANAATYLPVGPQTNVSVATVTAGGWTECYRDLYSNGDPVNMSAATVLSACTGGQLMMACRLTGDPNLILLAQGDRADVTFDTGANTDVLHAANGVGWYFNNSGNDPGSSWGFTRDGDIVNKNNCDVESSGADDERLCWHLNPGSYDSGGYRCGTTQDLNGSDAYERIVYMSDPTSTDVPTMNEWGMIAFLVLAGIGSVYYLRRKRVTG